MSTADIVERTPPKFPSSYIAKAIMFIPYSEIMEPFQAWYDEASKSSRVDYYGGIDTFFVFLPPKVCWYLQFLGGPVTTIDFTNNFIRYKSLPVSGANESQQ